MKRNENKTLLKVATVEEWQIWFKNRENGQVSLRSDCLFCKAYKTSEHPMGDCIKCTGYQLGCTWDKNRNQYTTLIRNTNARKRLERAGILKPQSNKKIVFDDITKHFAVINGALLVSPELSKISGFGVWQAQYGCNGPKDILSNPYFEGWVGSYRTTAEISQWVKKFSQYSPR
jgi:hypothetical protein